MRFVIAFFWIILLFKEWRCWLNWHKGYFKIGIPLLNKKIPKSNGYISVAKDILSSNENKEKKIGKLCLKRLSEREIGIRNKYFLLPPVRGRVIFYSESSVKLQIYIEWFMLVLLFYIIPLAIWSEGPVNPVADMLGLIGGILMFYIILIENFSIFLKGKSKDT